MSRTSRREKIAGQLDRKDDRKEGGKAEEKRQRMFWAAAYARISVEDARTEQSESIQNQTELILSYINRKRELCLNGIFTDRGWSGTDFNRPGFLKMMTEAEKGKINCIIVKDLSRLGRNYIETADYMTRIFPEHGIRLISLAENYDSSREYGDLGFGISLIQVMNDFYARDISMKVKAAFQIKKESGEFLSVYPPYGYRKDPMDKGHLLVDENSAPAVKKIFDWKSKGYGNGWIVKKLKQEGIPSVTRLRFQNGLCCNKRAEYGEWNKTTLVRSILRNRVYIGELVQNRTVSDWNLGIKNKRLPETEWIIHKNMHEPLITREQFEQVQKILDSRSGKRGQENG